MDFITGRHGQNHVTSAQFRAIIESLTGTGSYIAPIGDQLSMELAANNTVNINSGMLFHHGGVFEVKPGTQDKVTYQNGTQGMKRIDLIVARYAMNAEGIENGEWVVLQGEPHATNPIAPEYIMGNMQAGDTVEDCPVAEIHFDGINATGIVMLLGVMKSMDSSDADAQVDEVRNRIESLERNINNVVIRSGSCVRTSAGDSCVLFSLEHLMELFGINETSEAEYKFTATVTNGDGHSTNTCVKGTTWKDKNLYAVYDKVIVGKIRFNYTIVYTPVLS